MNKYLLVSLLIVGLASPAFAARRVAARSPDQLGRLSVGYGHPDPCWSLRLQRHRSNSSWWRFEDCLAYYNYEN